MIAAYLLASVLSGTVVLAQTGAETLVVRVQSEGEAVAGAMVRVGAEQVLTDPSGQATFRLTAGQHSIAVEAKGFTPAVAEATIKGACPQP